MSIDIKNSDPGFSAIGVGFTSGNGAPTEVATKGTIYVRLDGSSSSTRLYINTDGGTTWTSITTAA